MFKPFLKFYLLPSSYWSCVTYSAVR